MKLQSWLFFISASIILHMFGLSLYISFQNKITPNMERSTLGLEIISDTELSLLEKWSTQPSLNSDSQPLSPKANNDHPPVQQPNANSKLIYQKKPNELKLQISKNNSIPKISKNNMPVSDLNLTVRKPIRPTAMANYDKAYTAISSVTGIDIPKALKSNTKKDIYRQSFEPTTNDLPQIDIYKDLSNYEPNNPTDLLPKKPSQIDHRPDQKINNLDQLKNKIIKVIIIVLIVKFFEKVLKLSHNFSTPNDLLLFSLSILAICIGYYLINRK